MPTARTHWMNFYHLFHWSLFTDRRYTRNCIQIRLSISACRNPVLLPEAEVLMGLASRGGTPLQDLDLRRIQGVPGQNLDPGLNPGEFLFYLFLLLASQMSLDYYGLLCQRWTEVHYSPVLLPGVIGDCAYIKGHVWLQNLKAEWSS